MIIAFEGPDKAGKSTSATALDHKHEPHYNMTKASHALCKLAEEREAGLVHTFDRIDWMTHMVYRLALPGYEWNDERPRTVFAAPDTHLVFKVHAPAMAARIDDELYKGDKVQQVNSLYWHYAEHMIELNENRDFSLFKTVTILEVFNDPQEGTFSQRIVDYSSPVTGLGATRPMDDAALLAMLSYEDQQRL